MDGGNHQPLLWYDGTPAVAGEVPPSSRIDPHRASIAPILARIDADRDPAVWVDAGWDEVVLEADRRLAALDADYRVFQVKEKFGGLRFSCSLDRHPEGYRVIADAELAAAQRCERCGRPGEIDRLTPYLRTLCSDHHAEHVFDHQVRLRLDEAT